MRCLTGAEANNRSKSETKEVITMTNLKKEITENGIHFTLHGDYYFPDLER